MTPSDDPFAILGLPCDASPEEVKRAYRRLAMRWHPDRNPSAAAETEFKRIKAAYELALDPQRYAQWRSESSAPAASGADVTQTLDLTLEEAAHGCVKSVGLSRSAPCPPCCGTGRMQHRHSVPCKQCHGIGRLRGDRRGSHLCQACDGRGYLRESACSECAGSGWRKKQRTLSVTVPPGILHGERLRLARQVQHAPEEENSPGDLYLEIRIVRHPLFKLAQRDLHCTAPVSIFRLLAGGQIDVPTLNGNIALDLRPYPAYGLDYTLPAQGFPDKNGRGAGDLIVHLQIVYPLHPGEKDRPWLERLEAALLDDLPQRAPPLAAWHERMRKQRNG